MTAVGEHFLDPGIRPGRRDPQAVGGQRGINCRRSYGDMLDSVVAADIRVSHGDDDVVRQLGVVDRAERLRPHFERRTLESGAGVGGSRSRVDRRAIGPEVELDLRDQPVAGNGGAIDAHVSVRADQLNGISREQVRKRRLRKRRVAEVQVQRLQHTRPRKRPGLCAGRDVPGCLAIGRRAYGVSDVLPVDDGFDNRLVSEVRAVRKELADNVRADDTQPMRMNRAGADGGPPRPVQRIGRGAREHLNVRFDHETIQALEAFGDALRHLLNGDSGQGDEAQDCGRHDQGSFSGSRVLTTPSTSTSRHAAGTSARDGRAHRTRTNQRVGVAAGARPYARAPASLILTGVVT